MGDTAIVYRQKLISSIHESKRHLQRVEIAFTELSQSYKFPISAADFHRLLQSDIHLAFADQVIYRFSKAQDSIGAKLFKSFLLFQGENVDKPFLDILTTLEKINIVKVDIWFELREIRNVISHDYDADEETGRSIINSIHEYKPEMQRIISVLEGTIGVQKDAP